MEQKSAPIDLTQKPEKKAPKPRPDRVFDPAIQELKCVHGGNYKYSISKQSFFKVRCPFCYRAELQNTERKEVDAMVRAEYWRRHMTEVHNKARTKNFKIKKIEKKIIRKRTMSVNKLTILNCA